MLRSKVAFLAATGIIGLITVMITVVVCFSGSFQDEQQHDVHADPDEVS